MLVLSETYRKRLQLLAGIIEEAVTLTAQEISDAFEDSTQRFGFNQQAMVEAIKKGQVIGLSYQSEGMPVTKFRLIMPAVMGIDDKGQIKIRGYHLKGQSEKAAKTTGSRSAETSGEWRLFKASNIKSMWLTDKFFYENPPLYNPKDSAMATIIAAYNVSVAKSMAPKVKPQEPELEPAGGVSKPTYSTTFNKPTSSKKVLQKQRPPAPRPSPGSIEAPEYGY